MQLKIKLGQLFTKKNFVVFISTILFIGCAAFVAFRGYKCFDKYLKKPQHSEISFQSSKNHPFPSFTLCLSEKDSYNTDQLLFKCQLEPSKYYIGSQWVGKGGINCTDPKILHSKAVANYKDLEIEFINILTYANDVGNYSNYYIQPSNLSFLDWKVAFSRPNQRCFTLSIPEHIVHEGIHEVQINSKAFDKMYLHKEGALSAQIPGSQSSARYADLYTASVIHESIELLNYDGKHCNNDAEYNHDQCKQDYIYKV